MSKKQLAKVVSVNPSFANLPFATHLMTMRSLAFLHFRN